MKNTYTIKKTTELIGTLIKTDEGDFMVEVYGKEGLEDTVDIMALLNDSVNKEIAFKFIEEY
nr:MAG TPA: hypothetical protein [Caudoviricetes sp.]